MNLKMSMLLSSKSEAGYVVVDGRCSRQRVWTTCVFLVVKRFKIDPIEGVVEVGVY